MSTSKPRTEYVCEVCSYRTFNRKDYTKHVGTLKHLKKVEEIECREKDAGLHICACGREYTYRRNLHTHQKACKMYIEFTKPSSNKVLSSCPPSSPRGSPIPSSQPEQEKSAPSKANDGEKAVSLVPLVEGLCDTIKKAQTLQEQQGKIIDKQIEMMAQMVKTPKTVNNTINNNNRISINVFLNDKCKNAMNINEFIENLNYGSDTLERFGRSGYIEGVSHMMIEGMKDMDVTQRPIHCTDPKRESLYIKDDDQWKREDANGSKMKHAIRKIAKNNIRSLPAWKNDNPSHENFKTSTHEKYIKIVNEMSGGKDEVEDEKNFKKIIKKVATNVVIDRDADLLVEELPGEKIEGGVNILQGGVLGIDNGITIEKID